MNFKKNITKLYGKQGKLWLGNLPVLVNKCTEKWGLTNLQPMDNLSFNYVLAGMQKNIPENIPVILKLVFDKCELQKELDALNYFSGHGCVKVLDHDLDIGALLLERAIPGHTLKTFFPKQDIQATKIACQLIRDLHGVSISKDQVALTKTVPASVIENSAVADSKKFSQLADWLTIFDKKFDIPKIYLHKAKTISTQLLATTTKTVLLHGDLHHKNILSCVSDKWVAIDPKGVVGDPVYEVTSFMRNPWPELLYVTYGTHDLTIIKNRIQFFADYFGFDRQRIIYWVYVHAVLSACWAIEDNLDFKTNLAFADIIEKISLENNFLKNRGIG